MVRNMSVPESAVDGSHFTVEIHDDPIQGAPRYVFDRPWAV